MRQNCLFREVFFVPSLDTKLLLYLSKFQVESNLILAKSDF